MVKEIVDIFSNLNPQKIIGLIVLIILIMVFFPFIEETFIQPSSLTRQINNLNTLLQMDNEALDERPELRKIYDDILLQLEKGNSVLAVQPIEKWKKFVFGGSIGFLLLFIVPFINYKGKAKAKISAFFLMAAIGSVIGGIGIVIPDFKIKGINLYLYPGLQLLLLFLIAYISSQKKKNANS